MNIKLLKAQSILQEALQEALFDLEDNRLRNIAVTRVECSRGKEFARVFLDKNSLGDMEATNALKLLKKASGAIRANLQAQLSWYKTPNLIFEIDDSLEKINKIENIFKQIHSGDSPLELHSADSGESTESLLQGRIADSPEAIQTNQIDCHENALRDSRNDESFHSTKYKSQQ